MLSALLHASTLAAVDKDAAALWSAGYLYGATGKDNKDYLLGCFKADTELNDTIDRAMRDYAKGDSAAGDKEWAKAAPLFGPAYADCKDVLPQVEALGEYEAKVMARPDFEEFEKERREKYKTEIYKYGGQQVAAWEKGDYYDSGLNAAITAKYLGLAPSDPTPKRDQYAPVLLTAGWLFGVAEEDKKDELLACFKPNETLTDLVYDGMAAYMAGDAKTGQEKFTESYKYYGPALGDCDPTVTLKMLQIDIEALEMVSRPDWDVLALKIYADNKTLIDAWAGVEVREWEAGQVFNAGMFSGATEKIFLDSVEHREAHELRATQPTPGRTFNFFAPL